MPKSLSWSPSGLNELPEVVIANRGAYSNQSPRISNPMANNFSVLCQRSWETIGNNFLVICFFLALEAITITAASYKTSFMRESSVTCNARWE